MVNFFDAFQKSTRSTVHLSTWAKVVLLDSIRKPALRQLQLAKSSCRCTSGWHPCLKSCDILLARLTDRTMVVQLCLRPRCFANWWFAYPHCAGALPVPLMPCIRSRLGIRYKHIRNPSGNIRWWGNLSILPKLINHKGHLKPPT